MVLNAKANLLEGSVAKHIIRLTLPMTAGIVAIFMSNLIDALYVGRLGTDQLAALGFVFPVTFALMSIALGLGVGTASLLSRNIGKGDMDFVKRTTLHSLILSIVIVTLLAIFGMASITDLFSLFGPTESVMGYIREYMSIWYLGIGFVVIPMVGNSAIRATGDTLIPGITMGASAIVNLILDPFLIFGIGPFPEMALRGAALATVISWVATFVLAVWFLIFKKRLVDLSKPKFRSMWSSWGKILYIGVPVAMTNMLNPVAIAIVTGIVAAKGTSAVAAYGIGTRIEPIALVIILALTGALPAIVGQSWGAKEWGRVKESLWFSMKLAIAAELAIYLLLALCAKPLAASFTQDTEVIKYATWFMWIVPIGYAGHSVVLVLSTVLNAINKPLHAALLNIARIFIFILPLSFFGSRFYTVAGIFAGLTIAEWIMALLALIITYKLGKELDAKEKRKHKKQSA